MGQETRRRGERSSARSLGRLVHGRRANARGPAELSGLLPEPWLMRMFESLAPTYDVQNRLLSMGLDRAWRRTFVDRLRLAPGSVVGDLAVGTADIAIATCARYPGVRVVGVDLSPDMLRIARRKVRARGLEERIELRRGDLRALPIEDGSLDLVTLCFGIRNVEDRLTVLRECCRALRPGGRLRVMEMVMPSEPVVRALYGFYFDNVMPLAGNLMSHTDYAYSYLRHSIIEFPSDTEFLSLMTAAGLSHARASAISWGLAAIYDAQKPSRRGGT